MIDPEPQKKVDVTTGNTSGENVQGDGDDDGVVTF